MFGNILMCNIGLSETEVIHYMSHTDIHTVYTDTQSAFRNIYTLR